MNLYHQLHGRSILEILPAWGQKFRSNAVGKATGFVFFAVSVLIPASNGALGPDFQKILGKILSFA